MSLQINQAAYPRIPKSEKRNIRQKIYKRVMDELSYEPKICFFGKTGVGKSSLCNSLFGKYVYDVSHFQPCTKTQNRKYLKIKERHIQLIDFPGLGESPEKDSSYIEQLKNQIHEMDIFIYVLKADDRAYSEDVKVFSEVLPYLENFGIPHFIILNQVDKIEPYNDWDSLSNFPGQRQEITLSKKIEYIAQQFHISQNDLAPVSATELFNFENLVDIILKKLPPVQKIIVTRAFRPDFVRDSSVENALFSFIEVILNSIAHFFVSGAAVKFAIEVITKIAKYYLKRK